MGQSIAAVIVSWKRPHNIGRIIEDLTLLRVFDEIVVWDNSSILEKPAGSPRFALINSPENFCTYGRFLAAKQSTCDLIYTQDDDYLTGGYADELISLHKKNPEKIVAGLVEGHYLVEAHKRPWLQLGWGSVFRKSAINVLDQYTERFGVDDVLKRKADRIFTSLHGNHLPIQITPLRLYDPDGRRSESSKDALYMRPDHQKMTERAMERVRLLQEECE